MWQNSQPVTSVVTMHKTSKSLYLRVQKLLTEYTFVIRLDTNYVLKEREEGNLGQSDPT